ncbi:MAG TPA: hypothetical protein VE685_05595 [Thermoanaerobaculia bacterium]|nr:hypothetical protein [Thermoanaerobaculia bacterium]
MAETILQFNEPLTGSDGKTYIARVCGRPAPEGGWEGWIEFVPGDGTPALCSRRETRQPNRDDLVYWATGLTPIYLEGSLERTLNPPRMPEPVVLPEPSYDGPAPEPFRTAPAPEPRAVLDPFSVYAKGEDLLRQELGALSAWHLRNIVRAYALSGASEAELERMSQAELTERIVLGVRTITEQVVRES